MAGDSKYGSDGGWDGSSMKAAPAVERRGIGGWKQSALVLFSTLLLAGCGAQVNAGGPGPTNEPSPSPTPITVPTNEGDTVANEFGLNGNLVEEGSSQVVTDAVPVQPIEVAPRPTEGEPAEAEIEVKPVVENVVSAVGEGEQLQIEGTGNLTNTEELNGVGGAPEEVDAIQESLDIVNGTDLNFAEVSVTAEGWPEQEIPNDEGFFDILKFYLKMKGYEGSQLDVIFGRFNKGEGEQDRMLAEGYSVYLFADNALGILMNDGRVVIRFEISNTQSDDALLQPPIMLMLYSSEVQESDEAQVVTVDRVNPDQLSKDGKALLVQMQSYMQAHQ